MSIYNSIPSAPDNWLLCVYKQTFINPGHRHHNKIYIGYHDDYREVLDGTYPTSGKITKPLMKKYGIGYFKTEILALFCDDVAMKKYEAELTPIEEIYPQNSMSLNLRTGGVGFSSKDVKKMWEDPVHKQNIIEVMSGLNNPMYGLYGENHPLYGSKRTKEVREILSEQKIGEKNPMYGLTGDKCPNYKHSVSTQAILDSIKKHSDDKKSKLSYREWYSIAEEEDLIPYFTGRLNEINEILGSECKTMEDVFLLFGDKKRNFGKLGRNYKHGVKTISILKALDEHSKIKSGKLTQLGWIKIAKELDLIGNFDGRIPEMNKILGTDLKTMHDVFNYVFLNRITIPQNP